MVGFLPACLPLPFICLPFPFICLPGRVAFLFICLLGLSLLVSALFHWRCWCPPLSVGPAAFLFMCLSGPSLVVSALFRWPCSISILLSPRSVTGVSLSIGHEAFLFICLPGPSLLVPCSISINLSFTSPLAMNNFYSFVSQVRYCWCPPFSVGHVAFLFICLPGLSLLVSALFHWRCWCPPLSVGPAAFLFMCLSGPSLVVSALFRWPRSISILLSPRSVTGVSLSIGHEAFLFICLPGPSLLVPCSISINLSFTGPLAMNNFYSFVSQVRYCWCPPFSVGHVAFLFICLPGLSLLVSALFRRQCSISIHLSPRSVTAGVRPFPSAMQHVYSLVSQVCHCWCPPFSAGDATFLFICFPGLSLLVSALVRWPCSMSIHLFPGSVTGAAALFRWPCSISIHLAPM